MLRGGGVPRSLHRTPLGSGGTQGPSGCPCPQRGVRTQLLAAVVAAVAESDGKTREEDLMPFWDRCCYPNKEQGEGKLLGC